MLRKTLKWVGWIIAVPVAIAALFLIYVTVVDYKPESELELEATHNSKQVLKQGDSVTATTFNIGYAGLDLGQDFFMDGGKTSRSSSKKQTEANLAAIADFLEKAQSDFFLLQEVDTGSSRSYQIDEAAELSDSLPDYDSTYAINYKVPWVPVPVLDPMGKVKSGLMTLSSYQSASHTRYDLPGKESWPVQQMELDRAYIASRFPVEGGRELVLINLHLSAFDKGGVIRKQQLEFLDGFVRKESDKGNYLIVGGDWNHSLPGTNPDAFDSEQEWPEWLQPFPESFGPEGLQWANDPATPSVRTLDIPYESGINFLAVIDGFLVSPNIEIMSVSGHDLGFANSDHNPVTGRFVLK
ncbi:endonuclease/exonuclease/phosphatase family protein [Paenibacillus harenae]|uniref:Endonuclease/exonuclease/phosphatase family metal-dependent hydrolase n=1 Tax=Paenibacillus harenae TaxID=306543 RepID=A0ABT9TUM0_PAEHA|nr:endonuclease/exonuclease/phosphatase family protein [Paenibacillus harenae]MDQ0061077.1 endonuclease/exonuclease/phosphatase family metal-dependent hydrolase [Paenibacillus harenae]MDQ0111049.1 endonuclease/exonuclease/phosphatase family metal-dependent hydrolase [Paenibacillus harenae]